MRMTTRRARGAPLTNVLVRRYNTTPFCNTAGTGTLRSLTREVHADGLEGVDADVARVLRAAFANRKEDTTRTMIQI